MEDWSRAFDVSLVGVKDMLVLVETANDATVLLDILSDCGCTWPNDVSLHAHSNWERYAEDTVYHVHADRIVRYGSRVPIDSAIQDRYPGYIRCSFNGVPDLELSEVNAADCLLL